MIEILELAGPVTVQDLGRRGYAALGVGRSGAFDRGAARLANRLVGNPEGLAVLEIVLGGLVLRVAAAATVAVTGASSPVLAGRHPVDVGAAVSLPAGTMLRLGRPARGLRSYLAVRGGIDVPAVLGSCSTDTLSGIGPAPLRSGTEVAVGVVPAGRHDVTGAAAAPPDAVRTPVLPVVFGPRDDWFTSAARHRLTATDWVVRADCDRVGLRLDGPPLQRCSTAELPSEAVLPGAIQVPGDGRPILFGPDAPVTGGYPVIAVVTALDAAAQLRPGDTVRFAAR